MAVLVGYASKHAATRQIAERVIEGDFRDWTEIDAWSEGIGRELAVVAAQ